MPGELDIFINSFASPTLLPALLRLFLAALLGGLIGLEREQDNHPAGIRTHALVCVGAALIMVVSGYMSNQYGSLIDPTRLGAQVISGIGFLGAGTIIKEGFSVRGLTTAATLWVVSCVGLALGAGFYSGAIITAVLIYITLWLLKKLITMHSGVKTLCLTVSSVDEVLNKVMVEIKRLKLVLLSTQILTGEDGKTHELRFSIKSPKDPEFLSLIVTHLTMLDGVADCNCE